MRPGRFTLLAALLCAAAPVEARGEDETPVDVPSAWRENQAALGLPELPDAYREIRDGPVRWAAPSRALRSESEAVRAAFPKAWATVAGDLGVDAIPPLTIRLALNPEHLRRLSPRRAPAPEFAVGVAYPAAGLVLVSLTAEAPATDLDPVQVLTHELSHVALRIAAKGRPLPRWLVEGLAIEHAGENNLRRITTLFGAASREGLLSLRELDRGFSRTSHEVNVAYAQSADLVRYLRAQSLEDDDFRDLIAAVAADVPFEEALADTYGLSLASLERTWLGDLRRRYPRISLEGAMSLGWLVAALLLIAAFWRRRRKKRAKLAEMERREAREERLRALREAAEASRGDDDGALG